MYGLQPVPVPQTPNWRQRFWAPFIKPRDPSVSLQLVPVPNTLGWVTLVTIVLGVTYGVFRVFTK